MISLVSVTLKGIIRDRIFHGIFCTTLLFLFIPSVSSLSMRQSTELSVSLSLSLISFILLMLAIFLGGTVVWKDMERRYTYSVLGLPLTRNQYLLGKFFGVAAFLVIVATFLGLVAASVIWHTSHFYPSERHLSWGLVLLTILLDSLKYMLLVAVAFLFSSVSTSFFLPIFGTISAFVAGSATQQVFDFVNSNAGKEMPVLLQNTANALYYLLPNFSAFDIKVNAIYGIPLDSRGILLTISYFLIYISLLLFLATFMFSRRELR